MYENRFDFKWKNDFNRKKDTPLFGGCISHDADIHTALILFVIVFILVWNHTLTTHAVWEI